MGHRQLPVVLLGAVLVTLAAASGIQGSKADSIGGLKTLGIGGCRTADGGPGKYQLHRDVSLDECQEVCFGKAPCAALEYNRRKRECEVHRTAIVGLSEEANGDATCYVYQP